MAETKDKDRQRSFQGQDGAAPSSPSEDNEDGQELEQDQLDALYKKAQSFDFNTPEAEPAQSFALTLRPYQKQSLHWMIQKEKNVRNEARESSIHPLWEEYAWPTKDHDDKELPVVADQPFFYVNPYSGELSLDFPRQSQHCLGGILADEMGLGKTIQMLSLIHTHKSNIATQVRQSCRPVSSLNLFPCLPPSLGRDTLTDAPCTTLVVAPMSLLAQWQSEAENASKEGTLKSMLYYGNEKNADLLTLCCEANAANAPDLVITSYGVVLSEFTHVASKYGDRGSRHGLFSLRFFRVILDEAHIIRNRQSKTAKACYEIAATHRWVLTGTPIVNKLEDLFSLVRFLKVEPWNNFSFWRTFITVPFESKDYMRALDVVQTVLEPLVMRRTKDMRTPGGEPLVTLPPKQVEILNVELSKAERDVYDHIYTRAKRTFFANVEAGTVMKAFTSIFAQILRLRQSCCHPLLVRNEEIVADEEEANAAADAASGLADDMDLQSLIERFTATTDDPANSNAFGAHVLNQIREEAIVALIEQLRTLRREHPTIKSVVFSQFTSFLSLIEPALARSNIRFLRLDGSMPQKMRVAILQEFKESRKFTVLLLSLKAGGVGLNLTSAKRVYLMDPWWSFAVEAQAIDRVHRMGQEDEVKVYRFIVKDSVEERMLKIQERKKFIATSLGLKVQFSVP
ncbi:hypothetical protein VTH06DRAFT_1130 [Thermothelomyces fergusii]